MRYNRKTATVTTAPTTFPITRSQLKEYLKVDGDDEDCMLDMYIEAATDKVQKYCNRYFINTTITYVMDGFGRGEDERMAAGVFEGHKASVLGQNDSINLPYRPVSSITSIKTTDRANTQTTFSSASYRLDGAGGRVYLNDGYTWPTGLRDYAAVEIVMVCGYGSNSGTVPAAIKQAIMMHASSLYECRGVCEISDACKAILSGYRAMDGYGF